MCFYFKSITLNPKPLIAQKDIIVYKILRKNVKVRKIRIFDWLGIKYKKEKVTYFAPYRERFKYKKLQKTETVPLMPILYETGEDTHIFRIKKGYHSCKIIDWCKMFSMYDYGLSDYVFVEMVIPKGAEYFENESEIVSSNLEWR